MTAENRENIVRFRTILYYNSLFWAVWLVFYSFVFLRNIDQPYSVSLSNSTLITLPLFSLSLLLWPLVKKMLYSKMSFKLQAVIHILGANIYSALWLSIYYGILIASFGDELFKLFNVPETIGWQYPTGITYYLMISGAYYSLIHYREIKSREIKESQLQLHLKEMQFTALKNQLNPHFLFNSLNSINALITSSPQKARTMLIKLSDLLRLSISVQKQTFLKLSEELELARAYLDIEKIRLAERLEYKEKVNAAEEVKIPSMILQPLLENAVKHGVSPSRKKGLIELSISAVDSKMQIEVRNSMPAGNTAAKENNTGTGLKNIRKRLENIYGNDTEFSFGETDGLFTVKIELPIEREN